MTAIRVLLVDDHPVVRKGMRAMLEIESAIEVVGECSNGQEALAQYETLRPEVVLMDLVMPVMDGVEAIRQIRAAHPEARILVLTSFSSDDKVFAAIHAGAAGYLLKDSDPDDLLRAIEQVQRGESSLHPTIARKLLNELVQPVQSKPSSDEALTEREQEVLTYVAQGLNNQEIAEKMVVSKATVHSHVSRILSKLQLDSRTQAALYAIRAGYITVAPDAPPARNARSQPKG
jgi:two-component system, NarL family, response regulator LiaR